MGTAPARGRRLDRLVPRAGARAFQSGRPDCLSAAGGRFAIARGSGSFHDSPAAMERPMNNLPCAAGNCADREAELPPDPNLASPTGTPPRLITRRELLIGVGGLLAAAKAGKWLWT